MKLLYKKEKYRRFNKHKVHKQTLKWIHKAIKKRSGKKHADLDDANKAKCVSIKFPQNLFLSDEKEIIFEKLNHASQQNCVRLIFSKVQNISIGSALYIKAYVDSHKEKQDIKISCSPQNKKMREILQHMDLKKYDMKLSCKDVLCWTFRSWTKNNPENYGKLMMEEILPKVLNGKIPSNEFSNLASNLHELLYNCAEHAYTENDGFTGYYFIAGEYENRTGKSNKFSFAIIDMGQGFRSSLRKNNIFDNVMNKFHLTNDAELIKAAVDGKFNANPDDDMGRGTGLTDVRDNIKKIGGTLNISSDFGAYSYESEERLINRKNVTIGSIITVNLPIN